MTELFRRFNIEENGETDKIVKLPISQVIPNPDQPRKNFDEDALAELSASISMYGILSPLLVTPAEGDTYLLIAGERRYRAAQLLGLTEVPVIVKYYTPQEVAQIALIENLQRENLNYMEEAEGYQKLLEDFNMTQEAMAEKVGKKQSTIANKLRLLRLPAEVRLLLLQNGLTERHARALLKLEKVEQQMATLQAVVEKKLNVTQTEAFIDKLLAGKQQEKKKHIVLTSDVRLYVNSIKKVTQAIKAVNIPVKMEQVIDGDDVVVTVRIRNMKKPKGSNNKPLF